MYVAALTENGMKPRSNYVWIEKERLCRFIFECFNQSFFLRVNFCGPDFVRRHAVTYNSHFLLLFFWSRLEMPTSFINTETRSRLLGFDSDKPPGYLAHTYLPSNLSPIWTPASKPEMKHSSWIHVSRSNTTLTSSVNGPMLNRPV